MFFVPAWITNFMFLGIFYLSGFQHVQLKPLNAIMNIQFLMMVFCLFMVVVVALHNRENPWLSLGFFLTAVACLMVMIHQHRWVPPLKRYNK
jgi:hypothetical protein